MLATQGWIENRMKLLLAAVLVLLTASSGRAATSNRLFECTMHDGASYGTGTLKGDNITRALLDDPRRVIRFDEASGLLRFMTMEPRQFRIHDIGNLERPLVAIRTDEGPATNPLEVFVVETWRANMPFLYFDRTHVFTGTCELVNAAE